MWFTFRQREGQERRHGVETCKTQAIAHDLRGAAFERLDRKRADVLIKPCAPSQIKLGTRLQDRCDLSTCAAAHHACVPAVGRGEDVDDRRRFAVAPDR